MPPPPFPLKGGEGVPWTHVNPGGPPCQEKNYQIVFLLDCFYTLDFMLSPLYPFYMDFLNALRSKSKTYKCSTWGGDSPGEPPDISIRQLVAEANAYNAAPVSGPGTGGNRFPAHIYFSLDNSTNQS